MIITATDTGKNYEAQDERIEEVFDEVKEKFFSIIEKYLESDKDVTTAVLALYSMAEGMKNKFEDMFGYDEIIRVLEAKEIK